MTKESLLQIMSCLFKRCSLLGALLLCFTDLIVRVHPFVTNILHRHVWRPVSCSRIKQRHNVFRRNLFELLYSISESDVLYEDEFVIAISKPSGIATMPCESASDGTAAHLAASWVLAGGGEGAKERANSIISFGVVHRLDKEVSGALILAKNREVGRSLSKAFQSRTTTKQYVAVVHGTLSPQQHKKQASEIRLTLSWPLFRRSSGKAGVAVTEQDLCKSKPATTHLEILASNGTHSVLCVSIETGRFHQIRCHLSYARCPIVGDVEYGAVGLGRLRSSVKGTVVGARKQPHLMLHSHLLEMPHPVNRSVTLSLEAPLPRYMRSLVGEVVSSSTLTDIRKRELGGRLSLEPLTML